MQQRPSAAASQRLPRLGGANVAPTVAAAACASGCTAVAAWRHGGRGARLQRRSFEPFGGVYPREWALKNIYGQTRSGPEYLAFWLGLSVAALTLGWCIDHNWTDALIKLNVASFIVQCYWPAWEDAGVLTADTLLARHTVHRLLASSFLHASWYHVVSNMIALWQLGHIVERSFGPGRFLFVYLAGALGCSLLSLWGKRRRWEGDTPSVGASGGVFAVMAALAVFRWRHHLPANEIWLMLALNFAVCALLPQVDALGHVGGAAGGAAVAYLWGPRYVFAGLGLLIRDAPIITWPFS